MAKAVKIQLICSLLSPRSARMLRIAASDRLKPVNAAMLPSPTRMNSRHVR